VSVEHFPPQYQTDDTVQKYPIKVLIHKVDIGNVAQVDEWIAAVVEAFGSLDSAANIAGIALGDGQITESIVRSVLTCFI
jgi:NAD(P)-dependent dehydrogenase (short-subunit alcohol dehydrogenase family)